MKYVLRYEVGAATQFEAITKAGAMLRSGVRLVSVQSAEEVWTGWWSVALWVTE